MGSLTPTHCRPLQEKATRAIKSPCQFGCVGYLALAELLLIFLIFEYLQRQKYIYIANSLNTIHLKKAFCVLLPLNFVLPLLKTRQKRNITFLEYSKVLLGLAGQMWLFWECLVDMS